MKNQPKNLTASIQARLKSIAKAERKSSIQFCWIDQHDFDERVLQESISETFARRGTIVERDHALFTDGFAKDLSRATQWNAFLMRTGLKAIAFEAVWISQAHI